MCNTCIYIVLYINKYRLLVILTIHYFIHYNYVFYINIILYILLMPISPVIIITYFY